MKDLISFKDLVTEIDEDYRDPLTGLYSVSGLRHIMRKVLDKFDPDNIVEVIFFNVSEFALYNQTYDLTGGDKLLCDIADSLNLTFKNSVCARFAGDHFVVVTTNPTLDRDIMKIHNDVKTYGGKSMEIKAGIYEMRLDDDIMEAIDCARLACISIKDRFDKTYRFYDNSLKQALNNKRYVLDHVDMAIEEGWLKVYYQPIVRIRSGEICDFEALIRWDDPVYGMMQPNKFVPVLENSNQIYKIDMFVIEQVAKDLNKMREMGMETVPISVNLSRQDFDREQCMIFEYIEEILEKYNISKELIDIEITESILGHNEKRLRNELKKFNESGYNLWMDDFGTGFSSFNVLKNYHFDVLKIDMRFLKEIEDEGASEKTKTILYSIIRMAKRLGMETVCEGTETEERLRLLADLGCEKAQGYYFSRPIPFEQIIDLSFEYEKKETREYEQETGLISVLDPPFNINKHGIRHQPMALLEFRNGYARVLQDNQSFRNFFKGDEGARFQFEKWANSDSIFSKHFHEAALRACDSSDVQELDFVLNGQFGMIEFDYISRIKDGNAFSLVMRMENLQTGRGVKTVSLKQAAIRNVFMLYQFAHVFDIEDDSVLLLYNGDSEYSLKREEMEIGDGVRLFASTFIAPEDQSRFIEFYSEKHMREMHHSEDGFETNAFRTRKNDKYKWMIYSAVPFEYLDKWYIFSGCRDVDKYELPEGMDLTLQKYILEENTEASAHDTKDVMEEIAKKMLFGDPSIKRTLDLLDVGIFWKNKERRFVGANKYFLDYYGFRSFAEIAGLTDEEVGWHINPNAFKNDEEDVIRFGISINGKVGNCLRKGDNRTIIAFKRPLYVNGEIEGLVGCFMDVTDLIDILPKFKMENRSRKVEDVAVLNAQEYGDILGLYIREYERFEHDFIMLMIEIDGYADFVKKKGPEGYNPIDERLLKLLIDISGVDSVIARTEGNTYVVLHQFSDMDEVTTLSREVGQGVAAVLPSELAAVVNTLVFSGLSDEEKQDLKWNFASDKYLD